MKNQNNEIIHLGDFNAVLIGLIIGMVLVGFAYKTNEYLYTQSDVSALMKFNASNCVSILPLENGGLKIACNPVDRCESFDGKYCILGDTAFEVKIYTYFPQFANVSVVVEPERQECVNEITKIRDPNWESIWRKVHLDFCYPNLKNESYVFYDYKKLGIISDEIGSCYFQPMSFTNTTKCQTIPAVTKQINPWAVSENDLATEFCRTKTYDSETSVQFTYAGQNPEVNQKCPENTIRFVRYLNGGSFCIVKKQGNFTHGKVVEATCPTKKELSCSQKLIRCSSGDGTQKDFEEFK